MVQGNNDTDCIPHELAASVQERVGRSNALKAGVAELLATNPQLLRLAWQQAKRTGRSRR